MSFSKLNITGGAGVLPFSILDPYGSGETLYLEKITQVNKSRRDYHFASKSKCECCDSKLLKISRQFSVWGRK